MLDWTLNPLSILAPMVIGIVYKFLEYKNEADLNKRKAELYENSAKTFRARL